MAHALIVDDEATIRRIVDRVLRERGHTSEQADSGEAALLAVGVRRPDLILLDVNMGGMDGLEALPLLCRAVPGVPVVAYTEIGDHLQIDVIANVELAPMNQPYASSQNSPEDFDAYAVN